MLTRVGPFEVGECLGRGGVAEVWRARHLRSGLPVAIKVVTAQHAREPRFLETLQNEVRAAARLDHPAVARVLDYGTVSPEADERSRGRFSAGSPYLVMELASGGTLDQIPRPLEWDELVRVLLVLLDALAHAHARGVVHRDLKPANVLLASGDDVQPGLKLTDFGIAHALHAELEVQALAAQGGTPGYMAPEQVCAEWRDYGPWTDLYALGCLAFALATGDVPFRGEHPAATAYMHLEKPPPPLPVGAGLPAGFEGWVHRLLAKRPYERFQRAADAAFHLGSIDDAHRSARGQQHRASLDPPDLAAELVRRSNEPPPPTRRGSSRGAGGRGRSSSRRDMLGSSEAQTRLDAALDNQTTALALPWSAPGEGGEQTQRARGSSSRPDYLNATLAPPLPPTWRMPGASSDGLAESAPSPLPPGLGLFGRRTPPLVAREAERDALWDVLSDVRANGRPRVVVIEAEAGYGKSRLAVWLAERADEVGGAEVIRVSHGPTASPHDGLEAALSRHLGIAGLGRSEGLARLENLTARRFGERELARGLAAVLLPLDPLDPPGEGTEQLDPWARQGAILSYLERLSELRPVLVLLEDVEWSSASLRIVQAAVVEARVERPILFVLTLREAPAMETSRRVLLESLMARAETERIRLGPLPPSAHRALVAELLKLEPQLAERVAVRTEGNPLFATELIGDWVARGVLLPSPRGFVLAPGEEGSVPAQVRELWVRRLDDVLSRHGEVARQLLELLAVLGNEVDLDEWLELAADAGLGVVPGLVDALIEARLVERSGPGVRFVHGMVRETVEHGSRGTPRLARYHVTAALLLERRLGRGAAERIGRHWLLGRQPERALEPLLIGARERLARGDIFQTVELLELWDGAVDRLERTRVSDSDRVGGWLLRVEAALAQGAYEDAAAWIERATQLELPASLRAELRRASGELAYARSQYREAERAFAGARELFEVSRLEPGAIRCVLGLGDVAYRRGQLGAAERLYASALERVEASSLRGQRLPREHLWALWGLGYTALWSGDGVRALSLFERQRSLAVRSGRRLDEARALSALGEVARVEGQLARAEVAYREALGIYRALRSADVEITELNIGMVLLARAELDRAERTTLRAMAALESQGRTGQPLVAAQAQLAAIRAAKADGPGYDRLVDEVEGRGRKMRLRDGDLAAILRQASEWAERRLDAKRAERARVLSREFAPLPADAS